MYNKNYKYYIYIQSNNDINYEKKKNNINLNEKNLFFFSYFSLIFFYI